MSYEFEHLRVDVDDRLATVTIERPEALNALNDATVEQIDDCFQALSRDDAVRVVIVTGSGPKAFVAGADISELQSQDVPEAKRRAEKGQRAFSRIEGLGKPVIAAVNGFALGGGLELALSCHLRYGSTKARIGLPEVKLGLIPGYGGTQRLARVIGRGRALEWILTGEMYDAVEAHRVGVFNGVAEPDALMEECRRVAGLLLERGPIALNYAIEAVLGGEGRQMSDGLSLEAELFGAISATEDMREGTRAFLEKRAAEFTGK